MTERHHATLSTHGQTGHMKACAWCRLSSQRCSHALLSPPVLNRFALQRHSEHRHEAASSTMPLVEPSSGVGQVVESGWIVLSSVGEYCLRLEVCARCWNLSRISATP
jgi:hypothetical protein